LKLTELSRTVLKYAILENIRPIWVQIFSIEFNKFFVKILSMSYRYRIVSIRTTSLRVELNDYRSYLVFNIYNLDLIINIASKWTFSALSELKHLTLYSAIKNIHSITSKLKHLHFSVKLSV